MGRPAKKNKDWYWECEPAEVLADEDLSSLPAPDGWPDEGLSCVGLYWLMLCVMHRSSRRGYLLDSQGLPLKTEALARILRRSVHVVDRCQQVLVSSGLFSVDKHGVLYSRGMVRREEIKRKRRKAGSLGGLASKGLLKQMVEQMVEQKSEQNVDMGMNKHPPNSFSGSDFAQANAQAKSEYIALGLWEGAARLAFLYRSMARGRRIEDEWDCCCAFAELLRAGLAENDIEADLRRKNRVKSEYLWEIRKRLQGPKVFNGGSGIFDGLKRFAEKERE